ncbi:MAG TPA: beta-propeller fold lactonase family protein [Thermoleophilaceae bacterium]|nr:beta-propeller fold lactonase family protein [Thermoleophilaceae bacterium]
MGLSLGTGTARGDVGALTPLGCVQDNDTGLDGCTQVSDGLGDSPGLAVSRDGVSVYAASIDDHAIARFNRSPDGSLAPAGCVEDDDTGPDDCAQMTDGLQGVRSVAVSPDGRSVYAASFNEGALVRFDRAPDGSLTPAGCVDDNDSGADDCAQSSDGLDGARFVAVSSDGASVYVVSSSDDAVVRFDRAADGSLTPAGCVEDNDPPAGPDDCAQSADGLEGVEAVAVSADGTSVYAVSTIDDAVVRFDRSADGSLTPAGCVDDNDTSPDDCSQSTDGLEGAGAVTVSPDGSSVYVATETDHAVVRFDRAQGGALSPAGCVDDRDTGADDCAQSTDGLAGAFGVEVSPDGASLYAAAFQDEAVVRFNRGLGGSLAPAGCIDDNDTGPGDCAQSADGLAGVEKVVVSRDGASLYSSSRDDSAVARFARELPPPASPPPGTPASPTPACANRIRGTRRNDRLTGTAGGDTIRGLSGNDRIRGLAGSDCLFGERGNDRVSGDGGNDRLAGAAGRDRLSGASGRDRLSGGSGRDRLAGASGRDRLSGGTGNDRLLGGAGNDVLTGGPGRDSFSGGSGNDRIVAAGGRRETIDCGPGRDRVSASRSARLRRCERVRRR